MVVINEILHIMIFSSYFSPSYIFVHIGCFPVVSSSSFRLNTFEVLILKMTTTKNTIGNFAILEL